jgi:hypothetical protein
MTITGGQIREARALLEGSTSKLSVKAGLGTAIHQFEFCERLISRTALHMLRAPPEGAGVKFKTDKRGIRTRNHE